MWDKRRKKKGTGRTRLYALAAINVGRAFGERGGRPSTARSKVFHWAHHHPDIVTRPHSPPSFTIAPRPLLHTPSSHLRPLGAAPLGGHRHVVVVPPASLFLPAAS
eukprot:scaffold4174_cov122-Isochrysis_galbana.AAC.9